MTDCLEIPDIRNQLARIADKHTDGDGRLLLDPESVERDLARLVLAVMELLRELMELQAIRRFEAGSLTSEQEENLGETLFRARQKLREVAKEFGLSEDDLTLGLGLDAQSL